MQKDRQQKSFTLAQLAEQTNSQLIGDPSYLISNVADIETALPHDATFLANPRYLQVLHTSQAGVICIDEQTTHIKDQNYLVSANPSQTFQKIVEAFYPPRLHPSGFTGIHSTAIIHETAQVSEEAIVGPYAVIDEHAIIGSQTFIGAGSYIGPYTKIGNHCTIHPRVVIRENCGIEDHVIIQPGAVIGSCGFGYVTEKGQHIKLNQVGNVKIEKNVEIGANTTIDRARFKSTIIGQGSKIDNLVQIAHGVVIGKHNFIVSQAGVAGSSSTGQYVILAGQAAVAGHIHLEDGVVIAGKSAATKSLRKGKYGGIPAEPIAEYNRKNVYLRRIEMYIKQIRELESRVQNLENKSL